MLFVVIFFTVLFLFTALRLHLFASLLKLRCSPQQNTDYLLMHNTSSPSLQTISTNCSDSSALPPQPQSSQPSEAMPRVRTHANSRAPLHKCISTLCTCPASCREAYLVECSLEGKGANGQLVSCVADVLLVASELQQPLQAPELPPYLHIHQPTLDITNSKLLVMCEASHPHAQKMRA